MTSGQVGLDLEFDAATPQHAVVLPPATLQVRPRVLCASASELLEHERRLDALDKSAGGQSVWRRLG
jgi:DNA polymerase-3 subunit epsilon